MGAVIQKTIAGDRRKKYAQWFKKIGFLVYATTHYSISLQEHHVSAKNHQAKTGQWTTVHCTDVTLSDVYKLCKTNSHTI